MGPEGVGTVRALRTHQPIWTGSRWAGVKRIIIVLVSVGVGRFFSFLFFLSVVAVKSASQRMRGKAGRRGGGLRKARTLQGRVLVTEFGNLTKQGEVVAKVG